VALPEELQNAPVWEKGRYFEEFEVGDVLHHHWGRTFTQADHTIFSAVTLSYQPVYFNAELAEERGQAGIVQPMLVFCTVLGLSVEDLSEKGGAFLGVDNLVYRRPVRIGETVLSRSEVMNVRASASRPQQGIVTWHTWGYVAGDTGRDDVVIEFDRANLLPRRDPPP
jgi:itaconyl-CoA hydratase